LTLSQIAGEKKFQCPDGLARVDGVDNPASHSTEFRRIPKIVHQTAKSRCVTPAIAKALKKWYFDNWSYYFHDDEAILRLFQQEFANFPQLEMVVGKCLVHGTLKADLWRYIVLWKYGGIYSDLDSVPAKFRPDTIQPSDDAFFVVEQFHALSQYFIAVSPRHPLMWYAIQHSITNLLRLPDTGSTPASLVTGPHALHAAFVSFRKDVGMQVDPLATGYKPVWAGRFAGTYNRTVTVVGIGENQNEYIERDVLGMHVKRTSYRKMFMTHFQDDRKFPTGQSCLSAILPSYFDVKQS